MAAWQTIFRMRNVILAIVGLVVGLLLVINLLPDTINQVVTDEYTQYFESSTAAQETTEVVTLEYAHYYEDLTHITVSSDNTDDHPSPLSYDADSQELTIGGLEAGSSRILRVDYVREAHQEFAGFAGFVRLIPFLAVVGLVIACLWGLFSHFSSHRG